MLAKAGGESGQALVGGRLAVNFTAWRGTCQGGEWCIPARTQSVDRYWLEAGGGYADLRLRYGRQVWRWRHAGVGANEAEFEAWATGPPEVREDA